MTKHVDNEMMLQIMSNHYTSVDFFNSFGELMSGVNNINVAIRYIYTHVVDMSTYDVESFTSVDHRAFYMVLVGIMMALESHEGDITEIVTDDTRFGIQWDGVNDIHIQRIWYVIHRILAVDVITGSSVLIGVNTRFVRGLTLSNLHDLLYQVPKHTIFKKSMLYKMFIVGIESVASLVIHEVLERSSAYDVETYVWEEEVGYIMNEHRSICRFIEMLSDHAFDSFVKTFHEMISRDIKISLDTVIVDMIKIRRGE